MSCFISVRDVDFHPSTKGVRVRAWTGSPAHLSIRLSSKEPLIHKKPSLRRGVQFAEDVRFCFTVFEDNEQLESGDTYEHTWWKADWPVCTTKWLYFWGTYAGETCVSTTAPFSYHNTGVSPLPPPRVLRTFTSIEPNLVGTTPNGYWANYSVAGMVDQDATAILLHCYYKVGTNFYRWGVRPVGSAGTWSFQDYMYTHSWVVVKLNDAKEFSAYGQVVGLVDMWILGYFNDQVEMFMTEYSRVPPLNGWQTVDFSDVVPAVGVEALILYSGCNIGGWQSGIRAYGSTDNHHTNRRVVYSILKNNGGKVSFYKYRAGEEYKWRCSLIGYIKAGCSFSTNGMPLAMSGTATWQSFLLRQHYNNPSLVILEMTQTALISHIGGRKHLGDHAWQRRAYGGAFPKFHPDVQGYGDCYRQDAGTLFYHLGSLD